jgi:hypothetical protein
MKIRNQTWLDTQTHLVTTLYEPYWSAWKRYGWTKGVEGFGIAIEALEKTEELGLKIKVHVVKYGSYEISTKKARKWMHTKFLPRDHKPIIVIPRTEFDKINTEKMKRDLEKKEHERAVKNAEIKQRYQNATFSSKGNIAYI